MGLFRPDAWQTRAVKGKVNGSEVYRAEVFYYERAGQWVAIPKNFRDCSCPLFDEHRTGPKVALFATEAEALEEAQRAVPILQEQVASIKERKRREEAERKANSVKW